jgi:glutaminyl-peptide cyclotransferase
MNQKSTIFVSAAALLALCGLLVFFPFGTSANSVREEPTDPALKKTDGFDGDRALTYLKALCDLGPRISGSEGMKKQQEMIKAHFEKLGATVTFQNFQGRQPSQDKPVPMSNIIISFFPDAPKRLILSGHYDTRPIADQETNVRDWKKPFLSANDGTSTVAFLMEIGEQIRAIKPNLGVDFVIFDGEEWIFDRVNDKFFLGSEHFAREYKTNKPKHTYQAGILLDLFAAKGAQYYVERNSKFLAGPLVEDVWKIAKELEITSFVAKEGHEVTDDHLALNRVGIPCIDIIDMDYPHWHRLTDLPEQCSAYSMTNVAKVVIEWLKRTK